MLKQTIFSTLILSLISFTTPESDYTLEYISTYQLIAIDEMKRSGIPASITLAQAIHESSWGRGELALNSNNYFGIKCKREWTGATFYIEDDDYHNGKLVKSCFRSYDSIEASFKDHSDFLINNSRYEKLFLLPATDYISWAEGLQECGYATDPKYAKKLIGTIEKYGLYKYDTKNELAIEQNAQQSTPEVYHHMLQQTLTQEIADNKTNLDIPDIFILPEDYQRNTYLSMINHPAVVHPEPETKLIYSQQEGQVENSDWTKNTNATGFSNNQSQQVQTKRPTMIAPSYNIEVTTLNMIKEKVMITKGNTENQMLQFERLPRTNSSMRR